MNDINLEFIVTMATPTLPPPPYPEGGQSVFPNHLIVMQESRETDKHSDVSSSMESSRRSV